MDPELITRFEAENNCKVIISLYESNEEMLAKLQAGGQAV
jgi:spermidine/putrescine transport system substrate-binding protein